MEVKSACVNTGQSPLTYICRSTVVTFVKFQIKSSHFDDMS